MANESYKWETSMVTKLVVSQDVEVLSLEKNLQGCWHHGVVIDSKPRQRVVMYRHLFMADFEPTCNIVESVPVSPAIDGIAREPTFTELMYLPLDELFANDCSPHKSKRNNIRPWLSRIPIQPSKATFGMCVDACNQNAHWEGVIFDNSNDNSTEIMQRNVFFPDLGIQESVQLKNLSMSLDWDEVTGEWTPRGRWKFLEALEATNLGGINLCRITQLWDFATLHTNLVSNIGAWTCGTHDEWLSAVECVIDQLVKSQTPPSVQLPTSSAYKNRESSRQADEKTCYSLFTAGEEYISGKAGFLTPETGAILEKKTTEVNNKGSRQWDPVDLLPEVCPALVCGADYEDVTTDTARKHLLHLGWIVEYTRDIKWSMTRYRYRSPDGKFCTYSLRQVFNSKNGFHLKKDGCMKLTENESKSDELMLHSDDQSSPKGHDSVLFESKLPEHQTEQFQESVHINQSKLEDIKLTGENQSSPNEDRSYLTQPTRNEDCPYLTQPISNGIQPEYIPDHVEEYVKCIDDRVKSNLKGFIVPRDVRSNAKTQLLLAGWTQFTTVSKNGRSKLLYRSPSGKRFGSLLEACKTYLTEASSANDPRTSILTESGSNNDPKRTLEIRKPRREREDTERSKRD